MRPKPDAPGSAQRRITAVLGPTNTGKTHFAMERMLAHGSGMIGFPLRLLARENYDRAVRAAGGHAVALVTGEEKIVPPAARYFLCTVEAMPVDREVEFLAIDEVQLAADPERGHVFTDRMLHARGTAETVLIGADTVRPILNRLVPAARTIARPRFSRLAYAGPKKITRLPPRTAAVAFSAQDVYALAEAIRRRRGGAAVVLGALSPRARNAQVAMYQAGEVDYLVATDAIGMGLNMDVSHIAFSGLAKFDGRLRRRLTPAEIGQIAGRAGRHMQDGSFGTTANAGAFDAALIEAIESHSFEPLPAVYWRNRDLSFASVEALIRSLAQPPASRDLAPAREAEDFRTLAALSRQPGLRARLGDPAAVALLWECCQIPDFRKILGEAHNSLVSRIFTDLIDRGRISPAWIERQVARIDRTAGDIGALAGRIADIRTWTYVSHRSDWLDEPLRWQETTRRIEDRLSDALHERLTERFVDRRTAILIKRLRGRQTLEAVIRDSGEIVVEGVAIGRLDGFRFAAARAATGEDARAMRNAGWRALRPAIEERVALLEAAKPGAIGLRPNGELRWRGAVIGRLAKGEHLLRPRVRPVVGDELDPAVRSRVAARLEAWLTDRLSTRLGALAGPAPDGVGGQARALLYRLGEAGGHLPRRSLRAEIAGLAKADRKALAAHGVKLGARRVYYPQLLRPRSQALLALLWMVHRGLEGVEPPAFAPCLDGIGDLPRGLLPACGYVVAGGKAVRADRIEALWRAIARLPEGAAVTADPALAAAAGIPDAFVGAALRGLGYRPDPATNGSAAGAAAAAGTSDSGTGGAWRRAAARPRRRSPRPANPCSPFAILRELTAGR